MRNFMHILYMFSNMIFLDDVQPIALSYQVPGEGEILEMVSYAVTEGEGFQERDKELTYEQTMLEDPTTCLGDSFEPAFNYFICGRTKPHDSKCMVSSYP